MLKPLSLYDIHKSRANLFLSRKLGEGQGPSTGIQELRTFGSTVFARDVLFRTTIVLQRNSVLQRLFYRIRELYALAFVV